MKEDFKKGYYYETKFDNGSLMVVKCYQDCSYEESLREGFKGVVVYTTSGSSLYPQLGYFSRCWDGKTFKKVYHKIAGHFYTCDKGNTKPIVNCVSTSINNVVFDAERIIEDGTRLYQDTFESDFYPIDLGKDREFAIDEWKTRNGNQEPELNIIL